MKPPQQTEEKKFEERILHLRRVSKKTSGGNYVSFSALVAIGDGKGRVGIGMGRGLEVPPAIQKAISQAKKHMITIPLYRDTLPHRVMLKYKASRLLLKPAPPGTGLKVGGVARVILDIAGVQNASAKIIGTRNKIANAYSVIKAIRMMKSRIIRTPKQKEESPEASTILSTQEPKKQKVQKKSSVAKTVKKG